MKIWLVPNYDRETEHYEEGSIKCGNFNSDSNCYLIIFNWDAITYPAQWCFRLTLLCVGIFAVLYKRQQKFLICRIQNCLEFQFKILVFLYLSQ